MSTNPDHAGMSPEEIALMDDGFDGSGDPKELPSERTNAAVLALPDTGGEGNPAPTPAPAAAPSPAPAPAADEGDGTDPPEEGAAAPAAPAPAPEPAPAPAPAADEPDADAEPPRQRIDIDALKAERTTFEAEKAAAFAEMMDGTKTAEDYQAVERKVNAELNRILRQEIRHDDMVEAEAQADRRVVSDVMKLGATQGVDYKTDAKAQSQFDRAINMLYADPDYANKPFKTVAAEAHRTVLALRGITPGSTPPAATPAAPAPPAITVAKLPPKVDTRTVDKSAIPPTLSRVPPAADTSISGDEFAHLAGLTGADAERAYARLTPEQQERYLN